MNTDRRIEMGILAQRQRRRFLQVKRLGIKVPTSYKRIFMATLYPRVIQEALVEYPETVLNDEDYESDSEVLRKYSNDPLVYIR